MLVLSRKTDQAIVIQGGIVVKILDVSGDRVKLGVSAPREIAVLREELCDGLDFQNAEVTASAGAPSARLSVG